MEISKYNLNNINILTSYNNNIVIVNNNKQINIYDKFLNNLQTFIYNKKISSICCYKNHIFIGYNNGKIIKQNIKNKTKYKKINYHNTEIDYITVNNDKIYAYSYNNIFLEMDINLKKIKEFNLLRVDLLKLLLSINYNFSKNFLQYAIDMNLYFNSCINNDILLRTNSRYFYIIYNKILYIIMLNGEIYKLKYSSNKNVEIEFLLNINTKILHCQIYNNYIYILYKKYNYYRIYKYSINGILIKNYYDIINTNNTNSSYNNFYIHSLRNYLGEYHFIILDNFIYVSYENKKLYIFTETIDNNTLKYLHFNIKIIFIILSKTTLNKVPEVIYNILNYIF